MSQNSFEPNVMSTVIPYVVIAGFVLVFAIIIVQGVRSLGQWNKNNHTPVLTVNAKLVAKRTDVRRTNSPQANGIDYPSSYTAYYATFEVESGDRMEFRLEASEYGMLAESDVGQLTFQGTRYQGFERAH
jgi:hypothetical protein